MATIKAFIRTSTKQKNVNIRVRLSDGRDFTRYGVTEILVPSDCWDNKKEEIKARVLLPEQFDRNEIHEAIRTIKSKIEDAYSKVVDRESLCPNWIDLVINNSINSIDNTETISLSTLFNIYFDNLKVSDARKRHIKVLQGIFERYLLFYNKKSFDKADCNHFEKFIIEEHKLQSLRPDIYKEVSKIRERGRNSVNTRIKMTKAFFNWAVSNEYIDKSPFHSYEMKPDVYGDPIPLYKEEVEMMYNADVPKHLELVRDMFCLQCYLGCRVGDFVELKKSNIDDDILIYVANKTINSNPTTVYVPLLDNAKAIIDKYNSDAEDDRLLPFMNVDGQDGYNVRIKALASHLNMNRNVVTINPITLESEVSKLSDVISTHTARRTFINSNYKETQDPSLIAKMTGHSENSKAFSRYRKIDVDILKEQMKRAFKK